MRLDYNKAHNLPRLYEELVAGGIVVEGLGDTTGGNDLWVQVPSTTTVATVDSIVTAHSAGTQPTWDVTNAAAVPVTLGYADAPAVGAASAPARLVHSHGVPSTPYYQNALINGDMSIAPAGLPAGTSMILDGWNWLVGTSSVLATIAQTLDAPPVGPTAPLTAHCFSATITTADTSISATDLVEVRQRIEGYEARQLYNGMALSFWVKAHRIGVYTVCIENTTSTYSYILPFTVDVADTWEYKTAVIPPITGGSLKMRNELALMFRFVLAAGSNYTGTAGAWATGSKMTVAGAVNGVGATSDVFKVTLVNLIPGATPLPLQVQPIAETLLRCQRYREVIGGGGAASIVTQAYCAAGVALESTCWYRVTKGGTPTVSVNGTWNTANTAATKPTVDGIGPDSCGLYVVATALGNTNFYNNSADDTVVVEWTPV